MNSFAFTLSLLLSTKLESWKNTQAHSDLAKRSPVKGINVSLLYAMCGILCTFEQDLTSALSFNNFLYGHK